MAWVKGLAFAVIAFIILDAALFNGVYFNQVAGAVSRVAHLDWQGV